MLINNIGSIARRLKDEFETTTATLSHQGVKGGLRESVLKDSLRDLIPQKYEIGSGIVIDANNSQSRQQDFIIFDGLSSPVFLRNESSVVLPVECVSAITEIKSRLSKRTLEQAVINIASVKSLKKTLFRPLGSEGFPSNFIYGSIFAYSCDMDVMNLKRHFDSLNLSLPYEHRISTICVLDRGCIITANKSNIHSGNTQPSEDTITLFQPRSPTQALYLYYLILQFHLMTNLVYPPNLIQYANINRSIEEGVLSLDNESLESAGSIWVHGFEIKNEDIKRYRRIQPYYNRVLSDEEVAKSGFTRVELQREFEWGNNWILQIDSAYRQADNLDGDRQEPQS